MPSKLWISNSSHFSVIILIKVSFFGIPSQNKEKCPVLIPSQNKEIFQADPMADLFKRHLRQSASSSPPWQSSMVSHFLKSSMQRPSEQVNWSTRHAEKAKK